MLRGCYGDGQRQPADGAALQRVHKLARMRPVAAADMIEHGARQRRLLPGAGRFIFAAPDQAHGFACDPEAATAVVQRDATSTGAVERAVCIYPGGDGAGAGIDQIALAGRKGIQVGNLDIVMQPHRLRRYAQQLGQPQRGQRQVRAGRRVAAEASQPGADPHWLAGRQHIAA